MSDKKRKSPSAANSRAAKQQKLNPTKEEKNVKASGWLLGHLKQMRKDNWEMKFNKKRLRFISDTQKIKQGSEGVLYWMSRDQRVQGKNLKEKGQGEIFQIAFFLVSHVSCVLSLCSR